MRITGGQARGIILESLEAHTLRPSTDALRQAIFSSLGPLVEDARVLDVFAGTGAYRLEALSRGAKSVKFVEKNCKLQPILDTNAHKVAKSAGLDVSTYQVELRDAFSWKGKEESFDMIFIDPPYPLFKTQALEAFFLAMAGYLVKTPQSRLVIEHPGEIQALSLPTLQRIKRLGKDKRKQPAASIYGFL